MTTYTVTVHNRQTGERRDFTVEASCEVDAKVEALHYMFHEGGWRSCETTEVREVEESAASLSMDDARLIARHIDTMTEELLIDACVAVCKLKADVDDDERRELNHIRDRILIRLEVIAPPPWKR